MSIVGSGTMILGGSSSNTYTGTTTLSGTGQVGLSKTGGAVAIPGNITMALTGTRAILWASQNNQFGASTVLSIAGSGDDRFELSGTTQTLAGLDSSAYTGSQAWIEYHEFGSVTPASTVSTLILNVAAGNTFSYGSNGNAAIRDFSGGSVRLVKNGLGTQTLVGSGITYSGATSVTGGLFVLTNTTGYASSTYVNSGATLQVNTIAGWTAASSFNIAGTGTLLKTGSGNWIIGGGAGRIHIQMLPGGLIDIEGGTIQNNNVSTGFTLNQGSVKIAAGATLDAYSENVFLDALTGGGTLQNGFSGNAGTYTAYVGIAGGSGTFSGTIAVAAGNLRLTKLGAGMETLTGATPTLAAPRSAAARSTWISRKPALRPAIFWPLPTRSRSSAARSM